jgi:transcriptional regulator with PAS, ATPase and Fis domain
VLLRAIEEKAICPVGDTRLRKVDLRVVAATNRDLEQAIKDGDFRQDLFFRLNVIRADLPPLRERAEDIEPLVGLFVEKYNKELKCNCPGVSPEAMEVIYAHAWPGNVLGCTTSP